MMIAACSRKLLVSRGRQRAVGCLNHDFTSSLSRAKETSSKMSFQEEHAAFTQNQRELVSSRSTISQCLMMITTVTRMTDIAMKKLILLAYRKVKLMVTMTTNPVSSYVGCYSELNSKARNMCDRPSIALIIEEQ